MEPTLGDGVSLIIAAAAQPAQYLSCLRDRTSFRPDSSMSFFLYLDEELHVQRGKNAPST
jgi:hypothetical protein